MGQPHASCTELCASARDDWLRAVLASVGDRQLAEDCVAEAVAREAGSVCPAIGRPGRPEAQAAGRGGSPTR